MCSGSSLYSLKYSSEVAIVYASLRLTFGPCQQQQRSLYWRVHVPGWAANSSPSVARSLSRHTDWVRQRINWEKTTRTATCEAEELTDWGSAASSRHWVDLFIFYISLSIQYYIWDKTASKKKNTVYIYIYTILYTSVWVKFVVMVTCQVCREKEKKCWEKRDPSFPSGLLFLLYNVFFFFLLFGYWCSHRLAVALSLIFWLQWMMQFSLFLTTLFIVVG